MPITKNEYMSPLTGRPIKKGSPTYIGLMSHGLKPIPRTSEYSSYRVRFTKKDKEKLLKRCGHQCFLAEDGHYAICDPSQKNCVPNCSIIAAAVHKAEFVWKSKKNIDPVKRKRAIRAYAKGKQLLANCGK